MINVINADCLDAMRAMDAASIDSIVTDPPYGLEFMGKGWDKGVPGVEFWREALRVAKPGAHLVAFGGTRTYHRLACAVEDAGWEVRDCLSWMYGTGFPKSRACLKPAWEPAILARKRGSGVLAIDACRLGRADGDVSGWSKSGSGASANTSMSGANYAREAKPDAAGRWPANVCLDEEAAAALDEQSGERGGGFGVRGRGGSKYAGGDGFANSLATTGQTVGYGDSGGASRFFYTAKASKRERGEGNTHPTVKPLSLMQWVVRLVTPAGGVVLDPFAGSGTTGLAARAEGMRAILVEREAEYVEIINRRIAA